MANTKITKTEVKNQYLKINPNYKFDNFNSYIDAFIAMHPEHSGLKSLYNKEYKRETIPKAIRIKVWENTCGKNYSSECIICESKITVWDWEASHIVSVVDGGASTEDNLRPLCRICNNGMRDMNMIEYVKKYYKDKHKSIIAKINNDDLLTRLKNFIL